MSDQDEFDGNDCVVLPKDYLNSAEAVAEIYDEELAEAAAGFDVDGLRRPGFFRSALLAVLLWALSAIWSPCF